jgi:hypothetical protein
MRFNREGYDKSCRGSLETLICFSICLRTEDYQTKRVSRWLVARVSGNILTGSTLASKRKQRYPEIRLTYAFFLNLSHWL